MSVGSHIEALILSPDFAYLRPWFYQNPHALRCELGQGDGTETYMHNAYRYPLSVTVFEYWQRLCTVDFVKKEAEKTLRAREKKQMHSR